MRWREELEEPLFVKISSLYLDLVLGESRTERIGIREDAVTLLQSELTL